MLFVVVWLATLPIFSTGRHLAHYVKPCKRNDINFNECAKKHAIEAIPYIIKGDKDFNTPILEPFFLPEISIDAGNLLSIKLKDITIRGIGDIKLEDIRFDLEKKHVSAKFFLKSLSIDGQYDVDGRILVVPIKGVGPVHLDCENLVVGYTVDYKLMTIDGKEYVDPDVSSKVTYTVEGVNIKLENLFNGNKELGDRTNEFINEHALELNKDFSDAFSQAINAVATTILKRILPSVPYDEVFL